MIPYYGMLKLSFSFIKLEASIVCDPPWLDIYGIQHQQDNDERCLSTKPALSVRRDKVKEPSWFFLFFVIFHDFLPLFPDFLQIFLCQGGLTPQWLAYATDHFNTNADPSD